MKVTVLLENIQKALSLANHAISSKNQLPILSQVLLEAKNEKLKISATDLEIGIEESISVSVEEEGEVAVPAKLLLELINTLPTGKITLSTEEKSLLIMDRNTKTKLQITEPAEFPKLYEQKGEKIISFPIKQITNILKRIIFTSSIDSTRPVLSGILFKKTEEGVTLVATDGYRLSLETIKSKTTDSFEGNMIIPAKLIRELLNLNGEGNIDMYIDSTQNQIIFTYEETILIGRLIEGEFPNFEKILPTDASTTITVDKEELHKAVKTCAIFARETANIITFSIEKDKMVISSKTPSLGENTVDLDIKLKGEENAISFNAKYLLDFLGIADSKDLIFEMTGPLNSGVFKFSGNDSYLHLIMPIRTQS